MPREILNPSTLHPSVRFGFSHVAVAQGERLVFCAGQVAWDENTQIVGVGDLPRQVEQSLENVRRALAAAGATPADVVRLKTYLVDHDEAGLKALGASLKAFYGEGPPAPNTVVGVARLALPDFLVEIEATAVVR
jgi:enamine deaminase RidA (YjgF/YER057c/UK114 family)